MMAPRQLRPDLTDPWDVVDDPRRPRKAIAISIAGGPMDPRRSAGARILAGSLTY